MRHISWAVVLLLAAGTSMGQSRVTLTTSPAGEILIPGQSGFWVYAWVRPPGAEVMQLGVAPPDYELDSFRFTFKAHRTWPCPQVITLADNVPAEQEYKGEWRGAAKWGYTPPFGNADAGDYTLSVDVFYVGSKSVTPQKILKSQKLVKIGSATLKTRIKPPHVFNVFAGFSASIEPVSPVAAPASVRLTVSKNNPPASTWYRYTYRCESGCQPGTATKDRQGGSTTFAIDIPNPGRYVFGVTIDTVRQDQSTCSWYQYTLIDHLTPYYYTVNAPTP